MAIRSKGIGFSASDLLHDAGYKLGSAIAWPTNALVGTPSTRFRMPPPLLQDHHIDSGAAPAHQHAHIVFAAVQLQVNFLFSQPQS